MFLLNLIVDGFFLLQPHTGAAYICPQGTTGAAYICSEGTDGSKAIFKFLFVFAFFFSKPKKKNGRIFYVFALNVVLYVTEHHY